MSLTGLLAKNQPIFSFLKSSDLILGTSVRCKAVKAGGSTSNKCRNTPGKKRGIKVYDGQRVPHGSELVSQRRVQVLPGWNALMLKNCRIVATATGRAIMTTEKVDPNPENHMKMFQSRLGSDLPSRILEGHENAYKMYIHVIPDEQHQYFKLVEQI